jgi:hypothetical protein
MQGRAGFSCARAAHWADFGADLLGVELGSGKLRQRRPCEVGGHDGVLSVLGVKVLVEVGMTEQRLPGGTAWVP